MVFFKRVRRSPAGQTSYTAALRVRAPLLSPENYCFYDGRLQSSLATRQYIGWYSMPLEPSITSKNSHRAVQKSPGFSVKIKFLAYSQDWAQA